MSIKSKYIVFYAILILICNINNVSAFIADDPTLEDPVIILVDEGHGQFFNRSLYKKALSDLSTQKSMKIVYNTGIINRTSFEGVDIFFMTNPQESFSEAESHYIDKFISQGNAMFLLANPLDENNETLNGRGDIINNLLTYLEFRWNIGKFYTYTRMVDDYRPTNVIHNEFTNAGFSKYLDIETNISNHEILSTGNNITSIVTSSCSIVEASEKVISASSEAYTKTIFGDISSGSPDIVLFGASSEETETSARILLGGSSIMFSDLIGPDGNKTWYESGDNSIFWFNIFDWLASANPEIPPPSILSEEATFLVIALLAMISVIFIIGGGLSFLIGSGRKIFIVKSGKEIVAESKPHISDDETEKLIFKETKPPSKESRRDKRLRQIQKNQQQKRK